MLKQLMMIACLLTSFAFAHAQTHLSPVVTPDGTTIVFPDGYQKNKSYPAVYLLPYTGGTASDLLSMWAGWQKEPVEQKVQKLLNILYPESDERESKAFMTILPPEVGAVDGDGSWDGFQTTITRWEKRVKNDLASLAPAYGIDAGKIVVAGFSLGGDLSWALALRNPDLFCGAVVMGSHLSYGWELNWKKDPGIARLEQNGFRFALIMGANEDDFRVEGFNEGKARLATTRVKHIYKVMPDKAHKAATPDILKASLDYILFQ